MVVNYNNLNDLETGDVFFIKGKSNNLIDILIRLITRSWFIHSAILIELNGLWFVVETRSSTNYSYQLVPLEWWLTRHTQDQIFLGRMPNRDTVRVSKLKDILMCSAESTRPYSTSWCLLIHFLQSCCKMFKPNLGWLYKNTRPLICSTLIQEAWERVGAIAPENYMCPGDIVSYLGGEDRLSVFQIQDNSIGHNKELPPHSVATA